MPSDSSEHPGSTPGSGPSFLSAFFNVRKLQFWIVALLLAYTLSGFLLAPWLVERGIQGFAAERLGRTATVERVRVNPFVLSLGITGFELRDVDETPLIDFDEFFVNFQASSLFRWAWTFREFRLDGFHFLVERFTAKDSRIGRLLADLESTAEPGADEESGGLPRLLISQLELNNGSARIIDHVPAEAVTVDAGPVSIRVNDLNTLPGRSGEQQVSISLAHGAVFEWQGSLNLAPFHSEGRWSVRDLDLSVATPYLQTQLRVASFNAQLSAQSRYHVLKLEDGSLEFALEGLESDISGIALSGLEPVSTLLDVSGLELRGGDVRFPEQTVTIESLRILQPEVNAWLEAGGQVNFAALLPESDTPAASHDASQPAWRLDIARLAVEQGSLDFSDRGIDPPALFRLNDLAIEIRDLNNVEGSVMPITLAATPEAGGRISVQGQFSALPDLHAEGTASVAGLPLSLAQPYVEQQLAVRIGGGTLTTESEFLLQAESGITALGNLLIDNLEIDDSIEEESLLAWRKLQTDRYEADLQKQSLRLSRLDFDGLYGRIQIRQDQTTNLGSLVKQDPNAADPVAPDADASSGWSALIGDIVIGDGSMDFSDLSLPLPFSTRVSSLEGSISTVDSNSTEPANIRLEGQVDENGLARIEGSIGVLDPVNHTDITLEFRNLLLSRFTPYTVQFAGREIDQGKMDLDLRYVIDQGRLNGQNKVVLSELVLGDEVDNPDAASLPLNLAVALLTDANGVIDIDLPVEGDINDPEFRIGGVIWKAFTGLITKIVSAPFRLLGQLIGIDSEEFGQFEFLAGRADLTPPELEEVQQISQALLERPELAVEINGAYVASVDTPALKYLRLRDRVIELMEHDLVSQGGRDLLLSDEIRGTLETLYLQRFPGADLDALKSSHVSPPPGDPEGKPVLDELAYAAELRDRLLEAEEISREDLEQLAMERAQAIRNAFLAIGELDAARINIGDPAETESEDDEWVKMELGVAPE